LLKGDHAKAADLYLAAVLIEPESLGSHETSWKQARLLMDKLGTPPGARIIPRAWTTASAGPGLAVCVSTALPARSYQRVPDTFSRLSC
jgi:hypothetical protein